MLPRPTRAHYLGYIMRVVRYGRGYAGGILGGAIHPEMGRRNGALHPPRVSGSLQLRTLGFGYVLSMHMGMSGRPFPRTSEQRRVLGTSDQMTPPPHTHPHSPLHSAFQHRISAGLRSPDEYDAPENKTRRHSFISNGFTSRAEMPPTGKSVDPTAKK